jgi:hypothetical protein
MNSIFFIIYVNFSQKLKIKRADTETYMEPA